VAAINIEKSKIRQKFRPLRRIVKYIAGTPQNKKAETDELRLSHSGKTVALIAKSRNGFTLHSL
jgi:hypothetical protein